jgi:hypothetical protein
MLYVLRVGDLIKMQYVIVFTEEELDYIIKTLEKDQKDWLKWFNRLCKQGKDLVVSEWMSDELKQDQYNNIYLSRKDLLDTIKNIRRRGY